MENKTQNFGSSKSHENNIDSENLKCLFINSQNTDLSCCVKDYKQILEEFILKNKEKSTLFFNDLYGGHMNFDISKPHYDALLASLQYNQNAVAKESSPLAEEMEVEFVKSVASDIGYDSNSWGYVTSGGTISNIEALWIARNKALSLKKRPMYVLASKESHYSIKKSCNLLGLELKDLIVDENIPPNEIAAVVCNCGTTEAGTVEDIKFWYDYCHKHSIHLHADAAYGGYYIYCIDSPLLSEKAKTCLSMLKYVDSITIDPHKTGYAPYPTGMFLLKNGMDRIYVSGTDNVSYIHATPTSSFTLEGTRSGSFIMAASFGHKIMRPFYHQIMESNLIGSKMLMEYFRKSEVFELYEHTDLGMVLFTVKIKHPKNNTSTSSSSSDSSGQQISTDDDTEYLPMSYLSQRFCKEGNIQNHRLQLVTTEIDGKQYFRICVMNPFLKDHIKEFTEQLEKDYRLYKSEFDSFVNHRVENIISVCEECDTKEELTKLIKSGGKIVAYNGFEPSGRIHIAQAIVTVLNAKVLVNNGCRVRLYVADWFAQMNHKLSGDLEKIKTVGRYFVEVFKACGIPKEVEFVWASEFISNSITYWPRVLDITTQTTYKRAIRCSQIMGRKDEDNLSVSQLLYPCMQAADIFELGVNLAQLGKDQRKCNMLAREYAEKVHIDKPISGVHHMLMGLKGPKAGKMSKSIPDSAVFMEDSEEEVNRKIMSGYCTDEIVENPIYEYLRYIVFRWFNEFTVSGKTYKTIEDLEKDFATIDKKELKMSLANNINKILQPVREHFSKGEMKFLAETVASYQVTR